MWPFDQIRVRRQKRIFNAAVGILLGHYMFAQLDASTRARVESDVDRNYQLMPESPVAMRASAPWYVLAAERAGAMARLGISPIVEGVTWDELLRPFGAWPFAWSDMRPVDLVTNFHPFHDITEQAKEFLRAKGLDVSDVDPWSSGALHDNRRFLEETGLLEHWKKWAK